MGFVLTASSRARGALMTERNQQTTIQQSESSSCGGTVTWSTVLIGTLVSNLLLLQFGRLFFLHSNIDDSQTSTHASSVGGRPNSLKALKTTPSKTSFQLAYDQSWGFFDDIPDTDWIAYFQQPARKARHYRIQHGNPNQGAHFPAQWNFFNWDPYFNCPHLRKIGGLGGGPKWTCDVDRLPRVVAARRGETNNKCLVYSIGSRGNFRWELGLYDILGPLCEIHVFDFGDFERPDLTERNIHFHQWGLGSTYSPDYRRRAIERGVPFVSFPEIRKRLGHENRTIDLFKIDCESCEWHSYKDWITADLRQIMIETHELPLAKKKKPTDFGILPAMNTSDFFDAFQENGFVLFSKEVNSQRGFGRCVEWSFIKLRRDFLYDD